MAAGFDLPGDKTEEEGEPVAGLRSSLLPRPLLHLAAFVHAYGWRTATVAAALLSALVGASVAFLIFGIGAADTGKALQAAIITGLVAGGLTALPVGALLHIIDELSRARARLEEEIRRREIAERRMRELAGTDELTGLYNRRAFFDRAQELVAIARRYDQPIAILTVDIDHFKQVNDALGHAEGDRALQRLANILRQTLRATDVAARFGGDEFVVIMPQTRLDAALVVAERIRQAVAESPGPMPLSVSIGAAAASGAEADLDSLLARSDRALYAAKRLGRDRVHAEPPAAPPNAGAPPEPS